MYQPQFHRFDKVSHLSFGSFQVLKFSPKPLGLENCIASGPSFAPWGSFLAQRMLIGDATGMLAFAQFRFCRILSRRSSIRMLLPPHQVLRRNGLAPPSSSRFWLGMSWL
eukprot:s779_g5.t1